MTQLATLVAPRANGEAVDHEELRRMELAILDGIPPPIDANDEQRILASDPNLMRELSGRLCWGKCTTDSPCANCLIKRQALAMRLHLERHGRAMHPSELAEPEPTAIATIQPTDTFHLSDVGNAKRLVKLHGDDLRYCHPWSKWLVYDGRRWKLDDTGDIDRRAKGAVNQMYHDSVGIEDLKAKEAFIRHAMATERSLSRIRAMIELAKSEVDVPVLPAAMDADPWLLNLENGTLDLREGILRRHSRGDMLTKICPVMFDRNAAAPTWERFIDGIFSGDSELIAFVQRLLGYCLTGVIREQPLPIFFGVGANGKSTLLNAFFDLLGPDYSMKAPPDLLMAHHGEQHPTARADLFGKRFVAAVETSAGERLDEAMVKELTGGDRVRARRMREDFWEFAPTHKMVLCTNHKPIVRGTDHAIWRRLKMVPFGVIIPDGQQDRELPAKLKAELPGILNWCIKGCLAWQLSGLGEPAAVKTATADYRSDQDTIGTFIAENCTLGPGFMVRAKDIYGTFVKWCEGSGERPMSQKAFGNSIRERGFEKKTNNGTWYLGIKLTEG